MKSKPVEFDGLSERQEEAAKAAILEKVMKGRQPADLMLRCEWLETFQGIALTFTTGTILDADGNYALKHTLVTHLNVDIVTLYS